MDLREVGCRRWMVAWLAALGSTACTQAVDLDGLRAAAGGAGGGEARALSGAGGDLTCGDNRAPYGVGCPAPCTNCIAGRCEIDCALSTCAGANVQCPPGFHCVVACEEGGSCTDAKIACPADTSCELTCAATAACDGVTLYCGDGVCSLVCSGGEGPCAGVNVECGDNRCEAACDYSTGLPTLDCGDACECDTCSYGSGGG